MIAFLKRLWRDRRGNALIIAGAALPMLVGAAGLATDTIQWTLWKRELQRSADSAAFAGAYALAMSDSANTAVTRDIDNNVNFWRPSKVGGHNGIVLTAEPTVTFPTPPAPYTNAVQVTISIQKRLGFSSLFLSTTPTITTSATAAQIPAEDYCLITLKRHGGAALKFSGNPTVNLGCGAISDSDTNPSVDTGGTYTLNAPVVAGVGTLPSSITGVTRLRPHQVPMADPFASQYSTDVPAGMSCTNFQQHTSNGNTSPKTLTPGCYTSFAPNGGGNYVMQPGVYYLNNTDMTLNGNDVISGTGVTIIFTGDTPGGPKMNGNATINLAAPTDPTNPYYKMLFIQSPNAATENGSTINGTAGSSFDGTMYFPKGQLTFNGTAGAMTKCAMVVSYTAIFAGNTNLQNDLTGCTANQKKQTKSIRLIG